VALGPHRGKLLDVTMDINNVMEREGLVLSIWGSSDEFEFGPQPLLAFPQKCYCGTYHTFLDLTRLPAVRYLRAEWTMNQWGSRRSAPTFGFQVSVQESHHQAAMAAV
jgi:hypothetical protein